ncbi:hypothetical protein ANCDUO_13792 [Ancylostoma duodenale]|uniref:Uncharacterized protein n=1 Tax=Ancylostoma duodenale TaxID=51022 RepID=A0A0C2G4X4_9BILA|nr:hypothetical protein ANCDUO_13792 [Ancylostoma duodenale]
MDWFGIAVGGSLLLGVVALSSGYPNGVDSFSSFIDWLRTGSDEWANMQNKESDRFRERRSETRGGKSAKKHE